MNVSLSDWIAAIVEAAELKLADELAEWKNRCRALYRQNEASHLRCQRLEAQRDKLLIDMAAVDRERQRQMATLLGDNIELEMALERRQVEIDQLTAENQMLRSQNYDAHGRHHAPCAGR